MFRLEILFFLQIVTGAILIVLLYKLSKIRKQVDDIVSEVKGYIAFITEETEESVIESPNTEKRFNKEMNFSQSEQRKSYSKESKDDVQTQLIQAVLGEYFP